MRFLHGLFAAGVVAAAAAAPAFAETILHGFAGAGDGTDPDAALIADAAGNLYGTTETGGAADQSTVFELLRPTVAGTPWTNVILYSFQGGADGQFAQSPLLAGPGGVLYGTTGEGGTPGYGTIFALTPPAAGTTSWTETTLFSFTGGADGGYPYAGAALIMDASGNLFGTTLRGGTTHNGVVFELSPPVAPAKKWHERVLHAFAGGKDGYFPEAGLVADSGGVLYGTTAGGGASFACNDGCGTVYALNPPAAGATRWIKQTLHSFALGLDGGSPQAVLIIDANGALYGTTYFGGGATACGSNGCGTVYRLAPPTAGSTRWLETTLHAFQSGTDSEYPTAGVLSDASGALYGTAYGAYPNRLGAVFKLTPPAAGQTRWTQKILHAFTGNPDGSSPAGALLASGGVLYGTTNDGGGAGAGICGRGCGSVFQITP